MNKITAIIIALSALFIYFFRNDRQTYMKSRNVILKLRDAAYSGIHKFIFLKVLQNISMSENGTWLE